MKKFLFLLVALTAISASIVTAQVNEISTEQVVQVVQSDNSNAGNVQLYMTIAAFLGVVVRSIFKTVKGIKNEENGSPTTFDLKYWFNDNMLQKITSIVAIIVTYSVNFPFITGTWGIVILSAISFIAGYLIDKIGDYLLTLSKKQAVKTA